MVYKYGIGWPQKTQNIIKIKVGSSFACKYITDVNVYKITRADDFILERKVPSQTLRSSTNVEYELTKVQRKTYEGRAFKFI